MRVKEKTFNDYVLLNNSDGIRPLLLEGYRVDLTDEELVSLTAAIDNSIDLRDNVESVDGIYDPWEWIQ